MIAAIRDELLAVEQQQRSGDPVGGLDGVVVQESGDLRPAFVAAGGRRSGGAAQCGDVEAVGVTAGGGPVQEVPHLIARRPAREVGVDVALPDVGQGGPVIAEPAQQVDGGGDVDVSVAGVAAFSMGLFGGDTKAAQNPPGGVGMNEPPVVFSADAGQVSGPGTSRQWPTVRHGLVALGSPPARHAGNPRHAVVRARPTLHGCKPLSRRLSRPAIELRPRCGASSVRCVGRRWW